MHNSGLLQITLRYSNNTPPVKAKNAPQKYVSGKHIVLLLINATCSRGTNEPVPRPTFVWDPSIPIPSHPVWKILPYHSIGIAKGPPYRVWKSYFAILWNELKKLKTLHKRRLHRSWLAVRMRLVDSDLLNKNWFYIWYNYHPAQSCGIFWEFRMILARPVQPNTSAT